jgi:hypothetical protein
MKTGIPSRSHLEGQKRRLRSKPMKLAWLHEQATETAHRIGVLSLAYHIVIWSHVNKARLQA